MTYDVASVRSHFPSLLPGAGAAVRAGAGGGGGAAHFDGPGGSQVPGVVGDAVRSTLTSAIANRGAASSASRRAEEVVARARLAVADLLAAEPGGIVFGRSMTQLTYDFARTLADGWGPGDEVVVTRLDHDANISPWVQAAGRVGATVRWVDFDARSGDLSVEDVARVLSGRVRLVAVTGASNLIGSRPDLRGITEAVHSCGALIYIDGVHLTPHAVVDTGGDGFDFFACSPYKFLGPHCGVVAAHPDLLASLHPDKLLASTTAVPEKFELGTLPYELLAGTAAAIDYLATLDSPGIAEDPRRQRLVSSMHALEEHEDTLFRQLTSRLEDLPAVEIHTRPERRTPTLLFSVHGHAARAVEERLAERGVNAPAGSFYALEASRHLGLGDLGAVRVGLAPYTDQSDVDRLVDGIDHIVRSG